MSHAGLTIHGESNAAVLSYGKGNRFSHVYESCFREAGRTVARAQAAVASHSLNQRLRSPQRIVIRFQSVSLLSPIPISTPSKNFNGLSVSRHRRIVRP